MMKIGRSIDEFEVGMKREFSKVFTKKETKLMGDLIGDHNPFHYKGEFAKKSKFKKPIVHGFLVGGMICHFGGDIFPGPGYLAEKMEFKFLKPVFFGERIHAVGEVVAVDKENNRVSFEMNCFNQKGDKVLCGFVIGIPHQMEVQNQPAE